MLEQPYFGQRVREIRKKRRLSQAALAGEEISTGYLSRLESGARQPTERVVAHLAKQLGVDRSAFDVVPSSGSLAHTLSLAVSFDDGEVYDQLAVVLRESEDEDPLLRWQALWVLAGHWKLAGNRDRERACLEELLAIADLLGLPQQRCRSLAQLSRCLRSTGEIERALETATAAYKLAKEARLPVPDTARALLALISADTEAGRLHDARGLAEDLVALVEGQVQVDTPLVVEALWSAATVCSRQSDHEAVRRYLEKALAQLHSWEDLTLWLRLRLAAASLYLNSDPPLTEESRALLQEAEGGLALAGTPLMQQELLTLRTHLALLEGRYEDARADYDRLRVEELHLTYRDRIRLGVLDSRLLLSEGHRTQAVQQLKKLAEEAHKSSSVDLAAHIWRILAEALEEASWGERPKGDDEAA